MRADLVIEGARVHSLGPEGSYDGSIAVAGGRIIAIGPARAVQGEITSADARIDVAGRAVVPGFIDAHTHFQKAALARA
jgi:predicted amidohydrolase YtcJ